MKKFFSALLVVLFATSMMAQELGSSCENPIPVDKNYRGTVDGPCEVWYTAWTYDLPLHVYFSPVSNNSTWGPEVQVDFTCDEGVYEDPKLDSLINMVSDYNVSFPIELLCDLVVRNGKNEWDLSVAKSYREQLAEFGVPYNVQAFIKVVYSEAGTISLTPDTVFSSCMESAQFITLGDTIDIEANDTERVFVVSYSEWCEDSIQYVWTGDAPAKVYLAVQDCNFSPTSPYVWATYDVAKDAPYKVQSQEMKNALLSHASGGLYYAKVVSSGAGKLLVEKIPMKAAQGGAQVLSHGDVVQVEEDALYCFPKTWTATQFVAATAEPVSFYISNTSDFTANDASANLLASYAAEMSDGNRALYLSSVEIADLAAKATDEYLYVRVSGPVSTKVEVDEWITSSCAEESYLIETNKAMRLTTNTSYKVYRMRYSDIQGADVTIKWTGNGTVTPYISDTCSYFLISTSDVLLLKPAPTILRRSTYTIPASEVAAWASRVNEEGYLFIHLDATSSGNITFAVEKPLTPDPVYTTETAAVCFGEAYEWNGKTYTETGKYIYTTVAANGADSIVTLNLTIYPKVPVTKDTAAICYGETYPWQGQEYTVSGEYSVTLKNVNGCDSIVTLTLTVYPQTEATTETVEVPFGTTYEWNGFTYTESGEYTTTLHDENGCDYQATLILTILPEPQPENPCIAATTLLEPVSALTLDLDGALNVYRIDYEAWLASGVNLVWTGKEALHTFVAKDCEFAVAIYHKDVVNYTEVPAEGNVILSKAILAPLAQYVDADGYLYVRFLTEKEGVLTTAQAE